MNDNLISRETAVAILRAKADMSIGEVKDAASFFNHCANMIEKLPAVDAEPVVRCKNCVLHGKCITEETFEVCGKYDGFCCVGKKAEAHE